ncbi:hypothetical protein A3A79_02980 [Candidatus Gottesmanbacteria bacterium RIFCSPLOWO2_01_FULL_43_11b]|uniref:Glycosyltransferase RgtA/B/C/D-like domain-containing protein n=1 Tax=Candidatus Gottesmanbacteria bacterium RIFCSPLOWO2_01_FULL_43_11b TaxID=1798392 RepID=A0A1F6AH99_9BACT|nr:MAG: hypothetical protein A3A79_02980 [Candidatus Gottesmanbacteria bacterium RIFCSPLOWO2_01_FULL_43_11b]
MPSYLFFGPEQGRDFFEIKKITEGNFTLIGAKTDFDGIFHGPIEYYLAAVPFLFSRGNPIAVSFFFTLIQSATVFVAYALGKEISGKRSVGITSAILFAVSYGAVVYSRWLSQPPLAIPLAFLFLFFLFRFLHGKKTSLIGVAVCAGLLGQVQFINYLFVPLFLVYIIFRFRKKFINIPKNIIWGSLVLFLITAWGNFLLFDLRNNFLMLQNIRHVLISPSVGLPFFASIVETGKLFISWIGIFNGVPVLFATLIFVALLLNKKEMLSVWMILPPAVLILFRRGALDQLFVVLIPAAIVGIAMILSEKKSLIVVFVVLNLLMIWNNIPTNKNIFFQAPQPDVRYSDQIRVIDEIYSRVGNDSFEIQAYTVPHAWQDSWQYLFWYRGTTRYAGKLPVAHGGYNMFVIIQKDEPNRTFQENWYRDIVSKLGKLTDQFTIGEYAVEKRLMFQ